MKKIHLMILRGLPMPFFASMGILMFLLVLQFLMRYLPDLVGRGLPLGLVLELITYNLAYMVVLAVPMAVLIATLAAFTRLAESRAYMVISGAGISLPQIIWPVLILGTLTMSFMFYFNHIILPEANFRARNTWQDIRRKKPGFELEAGVFYDGVRGYSIRAEHISSADNRLAGITIYDYTEGSGRHTTIVAEEGELVPLNNGTQLDLYLQDGEIHRLQRPSAQASEERYERVGFGRHRLHLDLSEFEFERGDPTSGARTDRTMRTSDMHRLVDSLDATITNRRRQLATLMVPRPPGTAASNEKEAVMPDTTGGISGVDRVALRNAPVAEARDAYVRAQENVRQVKMEIESAENLVRWETYRANRYRVEIHKKHAIAVACVIFILVAVPIGLSVQKSGLGVVGALSVAVFLFYWVALVQGEKLADREVVSPWFGMWAANIVVGILGIALTVFKTIDHRIMARLSNTVTGTVEYLQQRFRQGAATAVDDE